MCACAWAADLTPLVYGHCSPELKLEGYDTVDPSGIIVAGTYQLLLIEDRRQAKGIIDDAHIKLFKSLVPCDNTPVKPVSHEEHGAEGKPDDAALMQEWERRSVDATQRIRLHHLPPLQSESDAASETSYDGQVSFVNLSRP